MYENSSYSLMMSGNWTTIDKSKRSSVKYAQSQEFLRSHLVFLGGKLPDVSSISQILSTKANIDPSNFHIEKFTHCNFFFFLSLFFFFY